MNITGEIFLAVIKAVDVITVCEQHFAIAKNLDEMNLLTINFIRTKNSILLSEEQTYRLLWPPKHLTWNCHTQAPSD